MSPGRKLKKIHNKDVSYLKLQKLKSEFQKQQGKKNTHKGTSIRLLANFSAETIQARREWHDTLEILKGKNLQPRILYTAG